MSKVLNVENGNYIVKVEPGEHIILDTSRGYTNADNELIGKVIINGQLEVKGKTTTINSTDLNINDNIIVLNKYEDGTGISTVLEGQAGIEIDRGIDGAPARFVWDESISWELGGDTGTGTFRFENMGYGTLPIYINGIKSPGTLFVDVGNEVISVTNSIDYERKCFNYVGADIVDNGNDAIIDDDNIPNVRALVDYMYYAFANIGTGSIISTYDTSVIAYDFDFDGDPSRVEVTVDGSLKMKFDNDHITTEGLQFTWTNIHPANPGNNLELTALNGGVIVVDHVAQINEIMPGNTPTRPTQGVRLYTSDEGPGDTGLYYVNKHETRDEMISRNRSLIFSMLF